MFIEHNLSFPIITQLSFLTQHFILERCINIINKMQVALPELHKLTGLAVEKTYFHTIYIRQTFTGTVGFKIVRVAFQYQGLSFFPCFKLKRSAATGVTAKINTILFHHFFRHNGTIYISQHT
ncbi:hypothetical protein HBF05_01747 [Campylobacter coli]|nr:hypothetical protein [Campylobacter coli]